LKDRPEEIRNKLFIDLYDYILPTNKLTEEEMKEYNNSVMELESLSLFTDYAKMEGIKIGRNEGIEIGRNAGRNEGIEIAFTQIVINAAQKGMSLADISSITALSVEQIRNILNNRKDNR
jgi:predicted transposase YdaD